MKGRRILVTRPEPECWETARQVEARGGVALLAPALVLQPPADPAPLQRAMGRLAEYDGVILTSAQGARVFLEHRPDGVSTLPALYAVGEKTGRVLGEAGLAVRIPPSASHGEALARWMLETGGKGRFLFLRAAEGREEILQRLGEAGCEVDRVIAYEARPMSGLSPEAGKALSRGKVDAITFFSGRSVESFLAVAPPATWGGKPLLAVLSPITGEALLKHGLTPHVTAPRPTSEALLDALADHWAKLPRSK